MHDSKVAIIIINWNGKNDTLECLKSLRQIDYPNFDVIVVDNGSSDESVQAIRVQFPEVIVLETGENLGFAGGNNVGMRYALNKGVEYAFLLNNDTVVDSQILKNFVSAYSIVRQKGILGAKIYHYSETNKIWYAGAKWINKISAFEHIGQGCIDDGQDFNSLIETDYACGCALFICKEIMNQVGLFDEKYFLIFEETDLCYRARRAGYKSFFVPEAKVWHKISTSFGGEMSPLYNYYLMRNKLLWAEKNLSFSKRMVLYKNVLKELSSHILPPRFHLNTKNNLLNIGMYNSVAGYRKSFQEKFASPLRKAKLWGMRDYLFRRFGKSPEWLGK